MKPVEVQSALPLRDFLLIKPDPVVTHVGGIELPGSAVDPSRTGTIVARGPDVKDTNLVPGVSILYGEWSGFVISINNEELLLMCEPELICIIQRKDPIREPANTV